MKQIIVSLLCICMFNCVFAQIKIANAGNEILFDDDWRFFRGDTVNAELENFDDASWRQLQVPHDWSIEEVPGTNSPFNPDVLNGVSIGFTTGGTGWYRKTFELPVQQKNKKIFIEFEGVYMNADVWINGEHLGNHPYGYTSFWYDITKHLKYGGKNTIAVEVKNEGQNSRWYSGSGIYRHVWLQTTQPVHIAQWGQAITTPKVNTANAIIHVQ